MTLGVNHLVSQEHIRQSASEAPAPTLDDLTIMATFDNANTAQIETGNLAAKRGSTNEVRQFDAMLVTPAFQAHLTMAENLLTRVAAT